MRAGDHAAQAQAATAVARQYGWDRVAAETMALYRRVLGLGLDPPGLSGRAA
jgi:hypothetical protein